MRFGILIYYIVCLLNIIKQAFTVSTTYDPVMGNSSQVIVSLRDREKERIATEADELGIKQTHYARKRLRAGMLLWDASGGFDLDSLDDLSNGKLPRSESPSSNTTEVSDVAAVIRQNLSQHEPTPLESESEDDIVDIVVKELITDALSELMDTGEVENIPGKGYQRK